MEAKFYLDDNGLKHLISKIDNQYTSKTKVNSIVSKLAAEHNSLEDRVANCQVGIFNNEKSIQAAKKALSVVYKFSGTKSWADIKGILDHVNTAETFDALTTEGNSPSAAGTIEGKADNADLDYNASDQSFNSDGQGTPLTSAEVGNWLTYGPGSVFNLSEQTPVDLNIARFFVDFLDPETGSAAFTNTPEIEAVEGTTLFNLKQGVNIAVVENPNYLVTVDYVPDEEYSENKLDWMRSRKYLLDILGTSLNFDTYFERSIEPIELGRGTAADITNDNSYNSSDPEGNIAQIPLIHPQTTAINELGKNIEDSEFWPTTEADLDSLAVTIKYIDASEYSDGQGKVDLTKLLKVLVRNFGQMPNVAMTTAQINAIWTSIVGA